MATSFSDASPPPPPLQTTTKSNLPMLYYGLIVVGTAAVVLALYNIIVIRWCTAGRRSQLSTSGPNSPFGAIEVPTTTTASFRGRFENRGIPSSFKYKKDRDSGAGAGGDSECAVCLSAFEEGEEIRKLPRCKHCFHAPCIDMWLYSHSDCPLCRTTVIAAAGRCQRHVTSPPEENSREVLLNSRSIPV